LEVVKPIIQTRIETISFSSTIEAQVMADEFREDLTALRVERIKNRRDVAAWKKATEKFKEFEHADDYRWIIFRNKKYDLTPNQASIIQLLDEERIKGNLFLSKARLCERIGASTSDPRDSFRHHPRNKKLLGTLILSKGGRYSLQIS
jgi:hypothetical protein